MEKVKNFITTYLGQLSYDIFIATLLVYTASLILETFKKGIVVDYFNIQNLLIVCMVSGVLAIVFPKKKIEKTNSWLYAGIVAGISLAAGYYVWSYMPSNNYAWLFALVTAAAVAAGGYALYLRESTNEK